MMSNKSTYPESEIFWQKKRVCVTGGDGFLGSFVQTVLNIHGGYITAAYLGEPGVELGEGTPLRFVISMVEIEGGRLSNSQVDWMRTIFENFALASR